MDVEQTSSREDRQAYAAAVLDKAKPSTSTGGSVRLSVFTRTGLLDVQLEFLRLDVPVSVDETNSRRVKKKTIGAFTHTLRSEMGRDVLCDAMQCCVLFTYVNIHVYKNGGR